MLPQPVRVFIVDDSAELIEALAELIADPGTVEIAGTGDSARASVADIERLRPDLIVVDLQLADGNGFEVVKSIRSLPHNENMIIALFTNHKSRELERHAAAAGANCFLDKSNDHGRLLGLIQEIVRHRQAS